MGFFQISNTGKVYAHPRSVKPSVQGGEYSMCISHSAVRLFMHDNRKLKGLRLLFMPSDPILLCVYPSVYFIKHYSFLRALAND